MVLPLLTGIGGESGIEKLYNKYKERKDKKKKQAYEAGKAAGMGQAGMENVGGGAGMSVNRKKGGKIKAKKKGGAPHNRLY
jgi:L-aminopeptidase/D-esterase-like protein